jgi:hypothetical protein
VYRVSLFLISLLVSVSLIAGGCGGPKPIKTLTDEEKSAMLEVAMANPEVSGWLEEADEYSTEARWVVIAWEDSRAVGWYWMEYEDIKDGTPPADIAYVTDDVTINPEIYIRIGEPARMFISVIFDSEKKKVLSIQLQPGRPTGGPMQPADDG